MVAPVISSAEAPCWPLRDQQFPEPESEGRTFQRGFNGICIIRRSLSFFTVKCLWFPLLSSRWKYLNTATAPQSTLSFFFLRLGGDWVISDESRFWGCSANGGEIFPSFFPLLFRPSDKGGWVRGRVELCPPFPASFSSQLPSLVSWTAMIGVHCSPCHDQPPL